MTPLIQFIHFNHLPNCRAWVDKKFPDYFALNYGHSRQISWQMDDGVPLLLNGPVAWWTWPGPHFLYGQMEPPGWDHCYVTFRGRWAKGLLELPSLLPRERPWQLVRDGAALADSMQAIRAALARQDELAAWSLLLKTLLLLRDERDSQSRENPGTEKIGRLIEEIRRAPEKNWSGSASARRLGFSSPHFRRLFRAAAGYPFHQFVLRARLLDAARRLRSGGEPIKSIAESCGVGDIHQFSRQFRAVLGQPPATYRRESQLLGD